MSDNPKVSVVMSVHNGEEFLREAVDSVLGQTMTDIECIVVNDGSMDRTHSILESYQDARIVIVHQENAGLTRSLNRGIRMARGNFIARQDADDVSLPRRLEMQLEFLIAHKDVAAVGTHASFIDRKGRQFYVWRPPSTHEKIRRHLIEKGNSFCHGSVMARRECLMEVGLYRESFDCTQDYDLFLRLSERYKVANLPDVFYKFRRAPKSVSRKKLERQLEFHLLALALASMREREGRDILSEISTENLEKVLVSRFGISLSRIRSFKDEHFLKYFEESVRTRDRGDALRMWYRSFRLSPRKRKIRLLLDGLLEMGYAEENAP